MPRFQFLLPGVVSVLASFLFLCRVIAHAQGRGIVEGKVVNGTDPSISCSSLEVEVVRPMGGMDTLKAEKTDAAGRFRIDGLPTDSMLMVRLNYRSVTYRAMVNFDGEGRARANIEVYETTASTKGISVEGLQLAFQLSGGRLRSIESHSINNATRPPRTFVSDKGSLRFSKAPGILEFPSVSVTAPGSSMPLRESPLESPDGRSYYLLYPLRPGVTSFQIEQSFPYTAGTYAYRKKFYHDVGTFQIGVIPADMTVQGEGLARVQTDEQRNFAVYRGGPIRAGTEVLWTFAGGTPAVDSASAGTSDRESRIRPMPNRIARNALVMGPLLLMAFIGVLWYAFSRMPKESGKGQDPRARELLKRRDSLLDHIADLDHRHEMRLLEQKDYVRQREQAKRQLRRVVLLLSGRQ
ncbi:MAG: hypothetical protein HXY20_14035 [Acidobacteria bacterium]|nr:hypothetical protein [Acidobacteriota bacterium]